MKNIFDDLPKNVNDVLFDEEWAKIVLAWSKWIQGTGPQIQGSLTGIDGWEDFESRTYIDRREYDSWRVKPEVQQARMFASGENISISRKKSFDPEPELGQGYYWLGPWQDMIEPE